MSTFDERMKARAKSQDCPIPDGFDSRMETLLSGLPGLADRRRPRRFRRAVLAVAIAAALCAGGAVALPELRTLQYGGFHGADEKSQPYSVQVGDSVTSQGYTFRLDGVGLDEAFITLYATITGEEPLIIPTSADGKEKAFVRLNIRADGEELEFWHREQKLEQVDEYTLRVTQRSPVMKRLPDTVELEVYAQNPFVSDSAWDVNLLLDKSAPDSASLVAEPKITFRAQDSQITVDKVVVAPSGSGLVLSEEGERPFTHFILRDDRGEILPHRYTGLVHSSQRSLPNFYEFFGGRTDMTSLTIVPWEADGGMHRVTGSLDALPLTDKWAENGYTLLTLEVAQGQATAVFQAEGILGQSDCYTPDFSRLDTNGIELDLGGTKQWERDAETGHWVVTWSYPDAPTEMVEQAAGVCFQQPNCTLREDQAVTIDLT